MLIQTVSAELAYVADSWRVIREELMQLERTTFIEWPERFLYEKAWTVFGIIYLGHTVPQGAALCPKTHQLLQGIPGIFTAGFSRLGSGAKIKPHSGNNIPPKYRCHLGLVVPEQCFFTVNGTVTQWQEGEWLCFDDAHEHSAVNESDADRIVLLVDILKPPGA